MMSHSYLPLSDTQKENQMKLYKFAVLLLALVLSACAPAVAATPEAQNPSASGGSQTESGKWCSGVTLRFFAGGDEGDTFASIVLRGVKSAEVARGHMAGYCLYG